VDDIFLIGEDLLIHECKRELASEFEMKDLGMMHYFLRLEVWKMPGGVGIYRVSSSDRSPKDTAHKQITD